ncbi:hypothetical protein [Lacinutrix venerupis]|uniref:Lipoprotein n=1 Tax=Lacinutrix venerupis TaxID=1486034 RepID=A0AAC9LIH1_9FLAO|nr:hypothetical protein [Lacinutrix venerupis]APX98904.1 hypothetical protein BWR22_00810 [Lacinutrix venerupis]
MRIIALIAITVLFFSCKNETKKEVAVEENMPKTEVVETDNFPKLEGVPQSLNYIFDEGYLYSQGIQISEVASYRAGENNYNFVIYLDKDTDLEELEKMTLGFVVYPKDLSVLTTAKEKKTKSKASGYSPEVYTLDNSLVLSIKDFKIDTNEFNLIKLYFYNKNGVLNDKILKLSNVKL